MVGDQGEHLWSSERDLDRVLEDRGGRPVGQARHEDEPADVSDRTVLREPRSGRTTYQADTEERPLADGVTEETGNRSANAERVQGSGGALSR